MSLTGLETSRRGEKMGKAYETYHGKGESVDKKKLVSVFCKCKFRCTARVKECVFSKIFINSPVMMNKTNTCLVQSAILLPKRERQNLTLETIHSLILFVLALGILYKFVRIFFKQFMQSPSAE